MVPCRMCMAVNVQMFTIVNTPLQDVYEKLTNISLTKEDGTPNKACYICYHILKKTLQLLRKFQNTDTIMKRILDAGLMLTDLSLNKIIAATHFTPYLGVSNLECTSIGLSEKVSLLNEQIEIKCERLNISKDDDFDLLEPLPTDDQPHSASESDVSSDSKATIHEIRVVNEVVNPQPTKEAEKQIQNLQLSEKKNLRIVIEKLNVDQYFKKYDIQQHNSTVENKISHTYQPESCTQKMKKRKQDKIMKNINENNNLSLKLNDINQIQTTKSKTRTFRCNHCQKSFSNKNILYKHINRHYKRTCEQTFQCTLCSQTFNSEATMISHLKIHNIVEKVSKSKLTKYSKIIYPKVYECNECKKQFTYRLGIIYHSVMHSKDKPFQCNVCNKDFRHKCGLTRHLKRHGKKEKKYFCDDCDEAFVFKHNLIAHLRKRIDNKPYSCKVCNINFCISGRLITHSRIHTGENLYSCNRCGIACTRKVSLVNHIESCDRKFKQKRHVNMHLC